MLQRLERIQSALQHRNGREHEAASTEIRAGEDDGGETPYVQQES